MQALAQRRGSLLNPAAHVRSATGGARTIEEITGILSQDIFDHGPPRPSVSTFDMAPLPHPRYVNLSSLAMGGSPESSEMDDSFYSHSPLAMSPGFPPHDLQAQMAMYESLQQHGVGVSDLASSSSPVMSAQASCHTHNASGRPLLAPAPSVPNETAPLERADAQMLLNGITMEEIAGFISGPEPNDGKWVCLYDGCAKRFGRKENIKSHVQTHLGDRQFKCQVCKKCFVRQHDLKRHSKIHTGVKPYPCLCGNSFARHDALTRHRQRGMCVGAFEGVVRKEVKRGRPRKKPLPKEDGTSVCGASSSAASDSSRETPPPGQDVEDGSASPSPDAESPCGMPEMGSSDEYTPPTSPSYDAESYAAADKATFDGFNAEPYMTGDPTDFNTPRKGGVSPYNAPGGDFGSSVDMSMFTDDIMGLTALERDPTILSYSYIKPELHEAPETNFYTDVNC
ncbi:hypothetical protein DFH27DRAFT_486044 [Peziza echinospora]|nr:hypothetical protein DFH27DRAFT_486044 [Peziza echinospora]